MKTLKFSTNIKCAGCINKVKPFLNTPNTIGHWEVDLESPQRILTIETSESPQEIKELLQKAGYQGTPL